MDVSWRPWQDNPAVRVLGTCVCGADQSTQAFAPNPHRLPGAEGKNTRAMAQLVKLSNHCGRNRACQADVGDGV